MESLPHSKLQCAFPLFWFIWHKCNSMENEILSQIPIVFALSSTECITIDQLYVVILGNNLNIKSLIQFHKRPWSFINIYFSQAEISCILNKHNIIKLSLKFLILDNSILKFADNYPRFFTKSRQIVSFSFFA